MATTEAAAQGLDDSAFECVYGMTFTYGYVTDEDGNVSNTIIDVDVYDSEGMIEENSEEEESAEGSESTEANPDPYTYTEDEFGNILTETNTQGNLHQTTTYTYSDDGNYLTSMTDADGNTVQYHYNSNTGLMEYLIDANNVRTEYSYNAMRELQMVNLNPTNIAGSTAMAANYTYTQGRLTGLTYGVYTYQFAYDIWGNVVSVTMNDRPLVTYNYGDTAYKGQVQTLTYGNNQTVYYTYNGLGQVTNVGYTNQPDRFNYVYATDGSLLMIEDNLLEQSTVYTETGYEIRNLNGSLIYSCSGDDAGNKMENVNGMSFQTTVDAEANFTEIIDGNNTSLMNGSRVYDTFDRLTRKHIASGLGSVSRNYQYATDNDGSTGNLVSNYSTYYLNATSQQTTLNFAYSYDGNGNITDIVRTERSGNVVPTPTPVPDDEPVTMILGGDRIVTSYTYDAAGQLLEAIDGETDHIYRYTYDNSGNITSAKTYAYDDDGNEVLSESKTFSYSNGILSSYNNGMTTVSCQTDAMGNPIRISEGGIVKTLSWGEGRMLLGVRTNASNYSQYFYGVDGLRTRKVVAVNGIKTTTEYAWGDNGLAGTIIRNGTATTTVVPHYDGDGEAIGFTVKHVPSKLVGPSTTNTYIYVKNLQGDVLRILDSNGNAVVNYAYDPWGKPTVTGDEELAALNPCSYRGYDYDEETGYYYLKTRYYNSETFRFLNADDTSFIGASGTVLSYNVFTYCENNPINLSDEFGCIAIPWQIKVGLAAGVASAIWEAVKYVKNNPKQSKTSWKFIKGLSKAITRGFVRGFLVGVLTSLSQSWRYGAIGGTLNLLYTITVNRSQGRSTSVDQGVSAFMNGWSTAVYSKTLSNVLKRVSRICKWSSKSADTLEYILDTMLGLGISHYFKW
jgi:RHS repeat-associated protein